MLIKNPITYLGSRIFCFLYWLYNICWGSDKILKKMHDIVHSLDLVDEKLETNGDNVHNEFYILLPGSEEVIVKKVEIGVDNFITGKLRY